jgi:serralysin
VFTALKGGITPSAFARNATGMARDTSDRIIYESDTGKLYYDRDGTGSATRVHFATLDKDLDLTHENFELW